MGTLREKAVDELVETILSPLRSLPFGASPRSVKAAHGVAERHLGVVLEYYLEKKEVLPQKFRLSLLTDSLANLGVSRETAKLLAEETMSC